ncbi:LppU/SCO3897 family protein [Nocardia terpenica]|uniref:Pyridine nucleotide-disulfide oxidoreductase n=1 Tax=Nocardia terpenica TaxID=455432 RepID=A0A6G9YWM5_9NOCA|nr:hypothetical protein [Nocardia terpenica]QIS17527.1 hypothetical protein F6W96_03615 [Nocardia terpenica]
MKFAGTRLITRLVLALVAMAVAALAVTGCLSSGKSDTAGAKVGDCINVTESSATAAKTKPVDCSSDQAVYKVMSTSGQKKDCGTEYSSYEEKNAGGSTTAFLCLAPNLKQGSCYHQDKDTGFSLADCTATAATVKVVKRVDGKSDEFLCDSGSTFLTVSDPKTTFCLANPKA